jgi:site-specific DNA-methyltransferase (adenine-specific)
MVIHGECLESLKTMAESSVEAIVTDPPYGISFMGKKWDHDVPSVEVWKECLRVLKPGGHMLVACGTRTQHRMAVNIEDAGFEIRDTIAWLYGSGFPKSLDISKAIDKAAGAEREFVGTIKAKLPTSNEKFATDEWSIEAGKWRDINITAPATPEAKKWQGWGTALKPALELWTLARKPLSESTVAKNVLKHGTGGLNVDGCRVEFQSEADKASSVPGGRVSYTSESWGQQAGLLKDLQPKREPPSGRFPANLILDEVAAQMLDEQSGLLKSGAKPRYGVNRVPSGNGITHGGMPWKPNREYEADSGGASRFFYCAKASKSERGDGNIHPTVKPVKLMRYLCRLITPPGGTVLDPFMGSGSTLIAAKLEGFHGIGIEREAEYVEIAKWRMVHELKITC